MARRLRYDWLLFIASFALIALSVFSYRTRKKLLDTNELKLAITEKENLVHYKNEP